MDRNGSTTRQDPPAIVQPAAHHEKSHAIGIFLTCLLTWTIANMDQSLFGYAIPGLLAEFALPLEAAGLILTVSFVVAVLFIIPAGIIADRFGRGIVLVGLLGSSAVMVAAQGWATGIVALTIFRALGFGLSGGLSPITNAMIVEHASPRWRGIAIGMLQCGYPLGWLFASLFAAPLLQAYGWRSICIASLGVLPLTIPIALLLKRYGELGRGGAASRAVDIARKAPSAIVAELFGPEYRRVSLTVAGIFFTFGGAYSGSAFFFPTFFAQHRGYSPADATAIVGLSNGIAVFGYMAAALVGEFLMTRRNVFVLWCLGGAAAFAGLLWLSSGRTADLVWYGATAALSFGSQAVVAVFVAELYPARIRASGIAICASAPLSLGFATFPLIVPAMVARFDWPLGLGIVVLPLLTCAGLLALNLPNRRSGMDID